MKNELKAIVGMLLLTGCVASSVYAQSATAERFAEVKDMSGEVQVKTSDAENWKAAQSGMKLGVNGEIKTGQESSAIVIIDESGSTATVDVKPNTHMRISELGYSEDQKDKKTMLDLALGQVLVQAGKLKGESSFQVRTPTSTTSVRGTVFEVKVEEA